MGSDSLSPVEQLVIMQSAYEAIGRDVARNGNGLRAEVDDYYLGLYEETGSKSFEVKLLGEDVGTMSIVFSKPKPETTVQEFKVTDYIALSKHVQDVYDGIEFEYMRKYIESHADDFAEYYFTETGECLPGTDIVTTQVPAEPKHLKGTTLRIDKSKVAGICERSLLPNITRLLLGDGR